MKKFLFTIIILIFVIDGSLNAQTWNTTGNAGTVPGTNFIGTTDAKDFVFKTNNTERGRIINANGIWRLGGSANNLKVDSTGSLSFTGTAAYKVAGNKYAFQYAGNPNYGLFFNSTSLLYEFRTSTALAVFSVGANSGNGIFKGNLKVGAYTLPSTDGTSGQVLKTNGTGTLTWQNDSDGSNSWSIIGNAGINSASNFIGTTDNNPVNFRINNLYAGQLHPVTGNVFLGLKAGQNNTTGFSNVAIGSGALFNNTVKSNIVAIGDSSLYNNGIGASTVDDANYNTAVGSKALYGNTIGFYNTAIGFKSMQNNTSGNWNCSMGAFSLYNNSTGHDNAAFGNGTLKFNTTGNFNTAFGSGALAYNSTGIENTAIGTSTLALNTIGRYNTAIGYSALVLNTADFNTAVGTSSMMDNTTGSHNSAFGLQALSNNYNGNYNTSVGESSLFDNYNGNYNTAIGYNSLLNNTSGIENTALGERALENNNTGNYNIAIGSNTGTNGSYNNTISIGNNGYLNAFGNQVFIGNTSSLWIGGQVNWSTYTSDARVKDKVSEDVIGLDFISRLRPVTYYININKMTKITDNKETNDFPGKYDIEKIKQSGFIAQEVEQASYESGYNFNGFTHPRNDKELYTMSYAVFVVPLVKAVQELDSINKKQNLSIDSLKYQNGNLRNENAEQQKQISDLNSKLDAVLNKMNNFETSLSECCTNYQSSSTQPETTNPKPETPVLEQNIPNPFMQTCYIRFYIPSSAKNSSIQISDVNGKVVKTFNNLTVGFGTVNINGGELSAGDYFYTLTVDGNKIDTKKMILTK